MRPLKYFRWWLLLGWLIVATVIYLSLTAKPPIMLPLSFGDKVGHFLAYSVLMGWFVQLFSSRSLLIVHALLLVAMGVGLEYAQGYGGRRHFEYADMVANSLGVLIGLGMLLTRWKGLLLYWERRLFSRA